MHPAARFTTKGLRSISANLKLRKIFQTFAARPYDMYILIYLMHSETTFTLCTSETTYAIYMYVCGNFLFLTNIHQINGKSLSKRQKAESAPSDSGQRCCNVAFLIQHVDFATVLNELQKATTKSKANRCIQRLRVEAYPALTLLYECQLQR